MAKKIKQPKTDSKAPATAIKAEYDSKRMADYYIKNKERIKARTNKFYHANKDTYKANRIKNKEKLAVYHDKWMTDKRDSDPTFRLINSLRARVYGILKHNYKSSSSLKLVGCSIEELQEHLKGQFQEGMTFDNYGEWHVDHIIPCSKFDLTNEEEQKRCFNYTNLQPLWAIDNLTKYNHTGVQW